MRRISALRVKNNPTPRDPALYIPPGLCASYTTPATLSQTLATPTSADSRLRRHDIYLLTDRVFTAEIMFSLYQRYYYHDKYRSIYLLLLDWVLVSLHEDTGALFSKRRMNIYS
jgi:hypothetical protein